jgi:lipopolysaccharide export system permease protein
LLRILDRYMLREFAGPLLFGIMLFAALMVGTILLSDVLRTLQRYDLSFWLILKYLALSAPQFLVLCIPMGALLGTLIAVGRLQSDHEVVALRAAGLDLRRVRQPFLIVGIGLAAATLLSNELVVPVSRAALVQMKNDMRSGKYGGRRERVTMPIYDSGEVRWVLHAGSMQGAKLEDVTLVYLDPRDQDKNLSLHAARGRWSGQRWEFEDLQIWWLRQQGKQDALVRMSTDEVRLPDFRVSPQELEAKRLAPEDISARQLIQVIRDRRREQAEHHVRPGEVRAMLELAREIKDELRKEDNPEARVLPLYERGELAWTLIALPGESEDELLEVTLFHFDQRHPEQSYVVYATRAVWQGRRGWRFFEKRQVLIDPGSGEEQLVSEVDSGGIPEFRYTPRELALQAQVLEDLNALELQEKINELQLSTDPLDKRELRQLYTELYLKYAIPLTPVFFIWFAFPLAILPQRASNTRGMGIALLILLIYMALVALLRSLGTAGVVPPLLAAWLPNIALALIGWRLMQKRQFS